MLSQAGAVYAFGCNQGGRLGVWASGKHSERGERGEHGGLEHPHGQPCATEDGLACGAV